MTAAKIEARCALGSIGYACMLIGEDNCRISSCSLKNATPERLQEITISNLQALENMIDYNIGHGIGLFRISSDIIPFASHPVNTIDWSVLFKDHFNRIGEKISRSEMRVSTHPGQYTVLNSPEERVVSNAVLDLLYHAKFMDALHLGPDHKMILHIGGCYADKTAAMERFISNYRQLPSAVKSRLVIENDDRHYTVQDVLDVSAQSGIPVVFDNLHHRLNPPAAAMTEKDWIVECAKTWKTEDGIPKIHYSQSKSAQTPRSHSGTIQSEEFQSFFQSLESFPVDIMLEVKDKNLSAIKCMNIVQKSLSPAILEKEWARYKYYVLSQSQPIYLSIRELLKDKGQGKETAANQMESQSNETTLRLYGFIEQSLSLPEDRGSQINAAQHVWGYMKKKAVQRQKDDFQKLIADYASGKKPVSAVKTFLYRESVRQVIPYLLESYYFYL